MLCTGLGVGSAKLRVTQAKTEAGLGSSMMLENQHWENQRGKHHTNRKPGREAELMTPIAQGGPGTAPWW